MHLRILGYPVRGSNSVIYIVSSLLKRVTLKGKKFAPSRVKMTGKVEVNPYTF